MVVVVVHIASWLLRRPPKRFSSSPSCVSVCVCVRCSSVVFLFFYIKNVLLASFSFLPSAWIVCVSEWFRSC